MYDSKGNFFHYSYQTGPNSVRPDDFQMPNYQQFILTPNAISTNTIVTECYHCKCTPSNDEWRHIWRMKQISTIILNCKSPAVHSTIPSSLFVNVINNRYNKEV